VIADGLGRAIALRITPGQAHELPHAIQLMERLPDVPSWVVADRGYTSHAVREHTWNMGAMPAIPPQRHVAPVACRTGSITTAMLSSASGPGSKSGAPLQPATKRSPRPLWESSASPPLSTGSRPNRPWSLSPAIPSQRDSALKSDVTCWLPDPRARHGTRLQSGSVRPRDQGSPRRRLSAAGSRLLWDWHLDQCSVGASCPVR